MPFHPSASPRDAFMKGILGRSEQVEVTNEQNGIVVSQTLSNAACGVGFQHGFVLACMQCCWALSCVLLLGTRLCAVAVCCALGRVLLLRSRLCAVARH